MKIGTWLIQVYEVADLTAQQSAASLLTDIPGLTLDARSCNQGFFVIVECSDTTQALAVYELVMMADPHAELIHSATSASGIAAVRERMATSADGDLLDA
jgi:hypothetical protein